MRLLAVAVILGAFIQSASAQLEDVKTDPTGTPNAAANADLEGPKNLQTFATRLEAAGYTDVVVMPKVVLVQAKDNLGNPVVMIVNSETMAAIQLQIRIDDETTGSGSSDETQRFRNAAERTPGLLATAVEGRTSKNPRTHANGHDARSVAR